MKHTFIPPAQRSILHREYHIRLTTVLLSVLSGAIVLGAAALFPAYIRAWTAGRTALDIVASTEKSSDKTLTAVKTELTGDNALITALRPGAEPPRLSKVLTSIAAARGAVTISSLSLSRLSTSTVVTTLNGVAPTRNDLLSFQSSLEALSPGASVNLPISELAQSKNVSFSIQLTQSLP